MKVEGGQWNWFPFFLLLAPFELLNPLNQQTEKEKQMKKLMIAAAIVCAAVAAQAMTTWAFWNIEGFNDYNGDAYSGNATLYAYPYEGEESSAKKVNDDMYVNEGNGQVEYFETELEEGIDYTFYFTAEKDGYTFKSGEEYASWGGLASSVGFTNPHESGTWTAPEPTSGLLMLLGMAGLALKRRRA